ncbi:MAG: single-stranded DNA-binding protein [bacterium]
MSANSMNRVFLMGNLTRDPAVRRTPAGASVADIGLAVSDSYTNKEGERIEQPCFVDVVAWNKQADACGQYLQKGSSVMVEGHLHFEQWETDKGEKRNRLRVQAERVHFLSRTKEAGKTDDLKTADTDAAPVLPAF